LNVRSDCITKQRKNLTKSIRKHKKAESAPGKTELHNPIPTASPCHIPPSRTPVEILPCTGFPQKGKALRLEPVSKPSDAIDPIEIR
jgi:hypothetical protein